MSADFTPSLGDYTELKPFRFWCQKVLPLVYDNSMSYYELLCKVVDYLNKTMQDVDTLEGDVQGLHDAYVKLQDYVNHYFDNLDVQDEINNKLDQMVQDGTLANIIDNEIFSELKYKTEDYVTPEMYGAKGDGITDDTVAIQTAINENKNIYFNTKTYLITAPIIINKQVKLFGSGNGSYIVKRNNTTTGDYTYTVNTDVRNLSAINTCLLIAPPKKSTNFNLNSVVLDGLNISNITNSTSYIIYISDATLLTLKNIESWSNYNGIYMQHGWGCRLQNIKIFATVQQSLIFEDINSTYIFNAYLSSNAYDIIRFNNSNVKCTQISCDTGVINIKNGRYMFSQLRTESARNIITADNAIFDVINSDLERHQDSSSTIDTSNFYLVNSVGTIKNTSIRFQNYTSETTWESLPMYNVDAKSKLILELEVKGFPKDSSIYNGVVWFTKVNNIVSEKIQKYYTFTENINGECDLFVLFNSIATGKFRGTLTESKSSETILGHIEYKPKVNIPFIVQHTNGNSYEIYISTNGDLIIDLTEIPIGSIYGSFTFAINDTFHNN